jgi:carbon storage regulator CsrA
MAKLNISRKGKQVRVGVTALKDVTIHREEIYNGIKEWIKNDVKKELI